MLRSRMIVGVIGILSLTIAPHVNVVHARGPLTSTALTCGVQDQPPTDPDELGPTLPGADEPAPAIFGRRAQQMPYIPLCGFDSWLKGLRLFDPLSLEDVVDAQLTSFDRVLRILERREKSHSLSERVNAMYKIADVYSGRNEMEKCIAKIEEIIALLDERGIEAPEHRQFLRAALGVAHMRRGELNNCIHNHNADSCIVPFTERAQHIDPDGFRKAKQHFLEYLEQDPNHLQVRWLVNIVAMGLGEYPDGVPPQFLITLPQPDPSVKINRFVDVGARLGVSPWDLAGGAIVDDFNGDGLLDIVTTAWAVGNMHYFQNNGDGAFTDRTEEAGLIGLTAGLNAVQADYDNDGDLDVLVLRGAWLEPQRNSLLRNDGTGRFTDVTKEAGMLEPVYSNHAACWDDYDLDGDLDVFIGAESWMPGKQYSQLFRNNGDGTFTDVAAEAGLKLSIFIKGADWGDYDNDGDSDLYLSNIAGPNVLFRNNTVGGGDGTFTDVTDHAGVERPLNQSFPCWFFDYNNDGWLDIFSACYEDPTDTYRGYLGIPPVGQKQVLYRNRGDGTFEDVTDRAGLSLPCMTMGANFGDLNTDGYPDIYLGTGAPPYGDVVPNAAFLNINGERYTDVTVPTGMGHLQKGHGIAFGDIDNDGDEDVYAQLGGAIVGDTFGNALFENPGHGNNWITIRLRGTKSNHFGVGSRIKVDLVDDQGPRAVHVVVDHGGSFGSSSLQQEIGLGPNGRITSIEIFWPASRIRQTVQNIDANQIIEITEGEEGYQTITLPRIDLSPDDAKDEHHHHHHHHGG